ncbi:ABC transporter ATP-binding protein [Microbispora triticiradicis]|uniref:ABC transporter ATP-binding protein n=3 Tax=Microbispora TaxID=2005 RepID=A0ABY3M596_9ACTN|nr:MULTISPECIES: ABC transporter ATP-binding protein [Microbispora]RGA04593.1 ABC transporter ATP-binding protein [Microbispora triticiradicis]TLP66665.1 ABC transporter ATP-binding protein [Microbispora fusca]TYB67519.1 ABC transporter ATP-binding protein [Microbispora tritici]GLW25583.1 ABC transporter ATP-binding protein [Microbispora amethystogenes]
MTEQSGAIAPQATFTSGTPVVLSLTDAELRRGERVLWSGLDLELRRGEFIAVLGPNGSGKTSLLHAILGRLPLSAGTLLIDGRPPRRGSDLIGYIPQQRAVAPHMPLRARDLVRLGVDGHRWGLPLGSRGLRRRIDELLTEVGAHAYADMPLGLLSGGEQQRVRVAQALATDPALLLCDEPLLSLDPHHQHAIVDLLDRRRRAHGAAVLFVTHELNPVLPLVDRVLYLAGGRFRVGTPDEVMTSSVLSDLYGGPVEVVRAHGRYLIAGAPIPHHPDHAEGVQS